jgi:serine/threonine-protein kinase
MAEVFCAEMLCQPGYVKRVAVKRVLPRLSANKLFLRMFLDEARLGLLLNHSNIVLVLDVGRAGDDYFIVMEYIDGVDLRAVWEAYTERGAMLPLELTLSIMVEICKGLDYAHQLVDTQGRPLYVVHHDINPSNVLLSTSGEVKLVDFGLSEAAVHVQRSDPDVVRGKFGYLSPEAAWGKGADYRSDMYAAAIILWEMVTGQRLFQGQDDMDSLSLAREARVPSPREFSPDIPNSLERIVMRALSKDPTERYRDARVLGRCLNQVLFNIGRPCSAFEIGDMVDAVRAYQREKVEVTDRAAMIERMIEEELDGFESLDYDAESFPPSNQPLWNP